MFVCFLDTHEKKKLIKYTTGAIWYTREDYKDKYRNAWKQWIRRKGQNNKKFESRKTYEPNESNVTSNDIPT